MTPIDWNVQWPDVVQAATSLLAFFAVPQVTLTIWNRFRYAVKVTMIPVDQNRFGASDTWQLVVANTSYRKMRHFELLAIPLEAGLNIVYASMQGSPDGGVRAANSSLADGGFLMNIERLGPRRTAFFLLRMTGAGSLFMHCDTLTVRQVRELVTDPSQDGYLLTMHLRVAILLLQFALAIGVLVARLIYLGLSGST
jgi:hypothetical protein